MNRRRAIILAVALLAGLMLARGALAQATPALERWVVGSAGGQSTTAGEMIVNSTLGEPIVGPSSGDSVSLGAGYWYGAARQYMVYLPLVLRSY